MTVLQQVLTQNPRLSAFSIKVAKVLVNKRFGSPHALPEAGHVGVGKCGDGFQEVEVEINNYPRGGGSNDGPISLRPRGGGLITINISTSTSPPPGIEDVLTPQRCISREGGGLETAGRRGPPLPPGL